MKIGTTFLSLTVLYFSFDRDSSWIKNSWVSCMSSTRLYSLWMYWSGSSLWWEQALVLQVSGSWSRGLTCSPLTYLGYQKQLERSHLWTIQKDTEVVPTTSGMKGFRILKCCKFELKNYYTITFLHLTIQKFEFLIWYFKCYKPFRKISVPLCWNFNQCHVSRMLYFTYNTENQETHIHEYTVILNCPQW